MAQIEFALACGLQYHAHTMEALQQTLRPFFRRHREIQLAYAFGSTTKRTKRPARDLDLAFLLTKAPTGLRKIAYVSRCSLEIETCIRGATLPVASTVDLVLLNDADPLLAHQVLRYGALLYERRAPIDRDFRVDTMTRYFETKRYYDFFYAHLPR